MSPVGAGPRSAVGGRRRGSLWLGLVLVAAGLSVLGYVGWQLWGTTWVAQREHRAIVEQLEHRWHDERSHGSTVRTGHGDAEAIVRIPKLGEDYAVPVLAGASEDSLAAGFGHLVGTARPGQVGNYAIAGHRVTHGEPLRHMDRLQPGDAVVVETARATYTYELLTAGDALEVPFTAGWVLDPVPHNPTAGGVQPPQARGQRLLTLTTCAELFHTDRRWVAFGRLTGVQEHEPRT